MQSVMEISSGSGRGYWPDALQEGFALNQTTSQCCRCCCLQPNIDWRIYSYKKGVIDFEEIVRGPSVWTIYEDAPYCGRTCSYCYPGSRKTAYSCQEDVGSNQGGDHAQDSGATTGLRSNDVILRHEKNCSCPINALIGCDDQGPIRVPCCCFLPYIHTFDARTSTKLGTTRLICNCKPLLCPKFVTYDGDDKPRYLIRPDLCCCNCCYVCPKCNCGEKTKCCYVPFFIRDYNTEEKLDPNDDDVAITDLYIGLAHECCTKKNLYSVKFPSTATDADKATLLGATLLYDITINEQNY